jgi:hypothetical protein
MLSPANTQLIHGDIIMLSAIHFFVLMGGVVVDGGFEYCIPKASILDGENMTAEK